MYKAKLGYIKLTKKKKNEIKHQKGWRINAFLATY